MSEIKKLEILKNILGRYYTNNDEYLFHCPRCEHHKQKLSINIQKNVFKCWVCDWSGGNIYRIVKRYGLNTQRSAWSQFGEKIEIENFAQKLFGVEEEEHVQEIDLPKSFVSLANKELPTTSVLSLNYLQSRGIKKDDVIRWKIGYSTTGKYGGRVIIPSFGLTGKANYFVTRTYINEWRKYLNPPVSKNFIFNELYLDFDEDLMIVEGVFDAIKAGLNSVPLLGSTLNENHPLLQKIVQQDTSVYLCLDSDANKKTNKLIELFLKYDVETYKVDIAPFSDVGEMTKAEFLERKRHALFVNSENYLLSRIARM